VAGKTDKTGLTTAPANEIWHAIYLHAILWLYFISVGFDSVLRNRKWISNKRPKRVCPVLSSTD